MFRRFCCEFENRRQSRADWFSYFRYREKKSLLKKKNVIKSSEGKREKKKLRIPRAWHKEYGSKCDTKENNSRGERKEKSACGWGVESVTAARIFQVKRQGDEYLLCGEMGARVSDGTLVVAGVWVLFFHPVVFFFLQFSLFFFRKQTEMMEVLEFMIDLARGRKIYSSQHQF